MPGEPDQEDLVAFLRSPAAYGDPGLAVRQHTTHISHVFLAGDRAYKLKRAVRLPYLDFSTVALRRAACEREFGLNRRIAPQLYLEVVPVIRTDGAFRIVGEGEAADWLVVMRRFGEDCLFDAMARRGALSAAIVRALADSVAAFHATAESLATAGGAKAIADIIDGNARAFSDGPLGASQPGLVARVQASCRAELETHASLLEDRRRAGKVRRCHGDLHLGNICLFEGRPVMFDCLDFSDALMTTDVLYDLAFLVMDLLHRNLRAEANLLFNRYLDRADEQSGLSAVPLFLAVRAAIRAHITASDQPGPRGAAEAQSYLGLSLRLTEPSPPRLIAIGGFSGSGKSTLAYGLAPDIGRAPGARVLRSDVIRKRLCGVPPEAKLDAGAYRGEVTAQVYGTLMEEAAAVLATGYAVVADAVFARPEERAAIAAVAARAGVPFHGLWLQAPAAILEERIAARRDDASDADAAVLARQIAFGTGPLEWSRIDISGTVAECLANARQALPPD